MKNFSQVLKIIALLVVVTGSTLGNEDVIPSDCPVSDQVPLNYMLITEALRCLLPGIADTQIPDFLKHPDAVDKARGFFHNYCHSQHHVHQCLERAKIEWNKCHDDLENNDFRLLRDLLKTTVRSFCSGSGAKFLKVWQELQPVADSQGDFPGMLPFLQRCMSESNVNLFDLDVPLNRRIFVVYKRMQIVNKCLFTNGKGVFISTNEVRSRISEILQKMRCHHPEKNRLVLCSTLNEEGTGDRTCTVGTEDDGEHAKSRLLTDRGFQCISLRKLELDRITNDSPQEEVLRFFNQSCSNLPDVRDCLAEVNTEAEVCLRSRSRRHIFKVFQEMLEVTVESGCSEDGLHLAQVFMVDSSAEEANAVGECIDVSVTRFKHVPLEQETETDIALRAYREATRLEQCFFKGLQHDGVRDLTILLMDDLLKKMRCVDPTDGNVILCKTIVSNNSAENNISSK